MCKSIIDPFQHVAGCRHNQDNVYGLSTVAGKTTLTLLLPGTPLTLSAWGPTLDVRI